VATIPYVAALGLALLGAALLAVGVRGPWTAALAGGVMLGAAAATTLIASGLQPLGRQSPTAAVLLGVLLGVLAALAGRAQRTGRD